MSIKVQAMEIWQAPGSFKELIVHERKDGIVYGHTQLIGADKWLFDGWQVPEVQFEANMKQNNAFRVKQEVEP